MGVVDIQNNPTMVEWLTSVHRDLPEVMLLPELGNTPYPFVYPIYSAERLLNRGLASWAFAGSQLNEYRAAITNLLEFNKLNQFPYFVVGEALIDPAGPTFRPETLEELLPYFEAPVTFKVFEVQPRRLLAWIINGARAFRLLKQLFQRVQELKRILYRTYFRFCGLTWSRRVWFLLHGSHPPKPETWLTQGQAFGCA